MNRLALLFLLSIFSFCFLPLHADAGWQHSITNYTRHSYKAASQNWMIMQCCNGWMYFANNKGLLEFDGTKWAVYPIHNAKMRAVKAGVDGRIYVGGLQQFGYFVPNALGELDYVCLSDSIDKKIVGNIWNIHVAEDRVYFQSDHAVFYLENERIHRVLGSITCTALVGQDFYVADGKLLWVLNGNEFVKLPNSSFPTTNSMGQKAVGLFSCQNKLLTVTNQSGLFFYENGVLSPYHSAADDFLKENRIICAAYKAPFLALGSVQNGVLLLNMDTGIAEHISIHNGLQNKTILSLLFDREDNLWLGLDNGIDCIHVHSPIFRNRVAIGSGYASCLYRDKLYLGTNQGVFVTDYPIELSNEQEINPIWRAVGQIYSLAVYDNKLFCAGSNALGVLDGDELYFVRGIRGVWWVKPLYSEQQKRLLAATYFGFYLLKEEDGRWVIHTKVKGKAYSSKSLYVEPMVNVLWTADKEGGLFRLTLSEKCDSIVKQKCYNSRELPKGDNVCIASVNNEVVVASRQGLFRYNHLKDSLERHSALEERLSGKTAYTYIMQDSLRNIWYVADGALKLLHYNPLTKSYYRSENETYLKDYLIEDFEHVGLLGCNEAIIGMEEGFSVLRFMQKRTKKYPLNLQIRHVYLTGLNDSLVYGRSYMYDDVPLKIPYDNNSIRIEYSVNNYDKSLALFYSCRLEGPIAETWSKLGESTVKEYTALPEGEYTFYVRTRINQDEPIVTSFSFEILPPWYRTWWSYILYSVLVVLILFYVYWRIRGSRRRLVMQKELELYHQKQVFQQESDLKDKKIDLLKEENLQAELRHKSEELVRTTLNIVRKNEVLQDIKKEVIGISHAVADENLVAIRRKTLRLIGQIDTNIEHDDDLQAFQSTFDSVHHDFFRKLEEQFPELTNREKLLCAYIKMDLLSKEIAPLLNLSQRGVEISRYRLRKKLGLGERENLMEFLQRFSFL